MSERLEQSPESEKIDSREIEKIRRERTNELNNEREAESGKEKQESTEVLSANAFEKAKESEAKPAEVEKIARVEKRKDTPRSRKKARDANFKHVMKDTRNHMSAPSRTFSKVIHNKAVERTSDAVGATVARPNALLAGAVAAFVLTLAVYLVAKHYGYPLSGFESIAAFIVGWVVGLLFDYLRIMITGKKA